MEIMERRLLLRAIIIVLSFIIAITSIMACILYLSSLRIVEGEPHLMYYLGLKITNNTIYVKPRGMILSIEGDGSFCDLEFWRVVEDCEVIAMLNINGKRYKITSQIIRPLMSGYRIVQEPIVSGEHIRGLIKAINVSNATEAELTIMLTFYRIEVAQDFIYDEHVELKIENILLVRPWNIKLVTIPLLVKDNKVVFNVSKIIVPSLYQWITVEKRKISDKELSIDCKIDVKGSELPMLVDEVSVLPSQSITMRLQFTLLSLILMIILIPYAIAIIYYIPARQQGS